MVNRKNKSGRRRRQRRRRRRTRNLRGGEWETVDGEANGAWKWRARPANGWNTVDIHQGRIQLRTNAGVMYLHGRFIDPHPPDHHPNPYFVHVAGGDVIEFTNLNDIAAYVVWIPDLNSDDPDLSEGGVRRKRRRRRRKSRRRRRRKSRRRRRRKRSRRRYTRS